MNTTIQTNKAYKGSVNFSRNSEGNIEARVVVYNKTQAKASVPIYSTNHGSLNVTRGGLSAKFSFTREKMSSEQITEAFYAETDEMIAFLSDRATETTIREAEEQLLQSKTNKEVESVNID